MDQLSQEVAIITYSSFFILLIIIGIIILVMVYQKKQLHYLQEREHLKVVYEKQLLETQLEIQEQTLKTISQEIHDNIGQVLSLAKLNLNSIPPAETLAVATKIDDTKKLVSKAINDLRDLSRSIHGDLIEEIGLKNSIDNELKIIQNTGIYTCSLLVTGNEYSLQKQKEMVLFRMVQEALNNSIKHAKATSISVVIDYGEAIFSLTVKDDGKGFNPLQLSSEKKGIGLTSMQNRATMIDGSFSLISIPDEGTSISITLLTNNPV